MFEITVPATSGELDTVLDFTTMHMEEAGFPPEVLNSVLIAVEEIYVNVANYAYNPTLGEATIRCEIEEGNGISIEILDGGKPYNPLDRDDPDIGLSAEERDIGGLGIFMVKTIMDSIEYRHENGKNILTMKKKQG